MKSWLLERSGWGYILIASPLIIYWLYWTFNTSYWFNADPAAVYFLDSLSIFAGKSYTYVDHPGTPLQLIGSFLLALTYPFLDSSEAFISFHLARPDDHIPGEVLYVRGIFGYIEFNVAVPNGMLIGAHDTYFLFE